MATAIKMGGSGNPYLATILPPQVKLIADYTGNPPNIKVNLYFDKVPADQMQYLKDYVIVVNENHIPENPTDGTVIVVSKEVGK